MSLYISINGVHNCLKFYDYGHLRCEKLSKSEVSPLPRSPVLLPSKLGKRDSHSYLADEKPETPQRGQGSTRSP